MTAAQEPLNQFTPGKPGPDPRLRAYHRLRAGAPGHRYEYPSRAATGAGRWLRGGRGAWGKSFRLGDADSAMTPWARRSEARPQVAGGPLLSQPRRTPRRCGPAPAPPRIL